MIKVQKPLKISGKTIGKILYQDGDPSVKLIKKTIQSSFKRLKETYKIAPKNISFLCFELVYSREELNKKIYKRTPDWLVGLFHKNKIYLFSPTVIEKFSPHKKTYINRLITHELCHLFNYAVNPSLPLWLNEGIALILADQKKDSHISKSDWLFFKKNLTNKKINSKDFSGHSGYRISYTLTNHLLDKLGRDSLSQLVKITPKKDKSYAKILRLSIAYINNLTN